MKILSIKQVDAFTTAPFSGNPAGVVAEAQGLTGSQMQTIAAEMNLSETAFVLPTMLSGADFNLKWFTPTNEVKLCGHATIATFHALAEEGRYGMSQPGEYSFKIETRSGILPVSVTVPESGSGSAEVALGVPAPRFFEVSLNNETVARILGINPDDFSEELKFMQDNFQLVIPVKNLHLLHAIKPDFGAMIDYCSELDTQAFTPITTETADPASVFQSRCFVPVLGVNEDPVTGSSQGPLGVYALHSGIVPDTDFAQMIGEQGDAMNRPGRVKITVRKSGNLIKEVTITGKAVTVFDANLRLPDTFFMETGADA